MFFWPWSLLLDFLFFGLNLPSPVTLLRISINAENTPKAAAIVPSARTLYLFPVRLLNSFLYASFTPFDPRTTRPSAVLPFPQRFSGFSIGPPNIFEEQRYDRLTSLY